MACIRRRRGKWVVDYRDAAGIRRWLTRETRRAAEAVLADRLESRERAREEDAVVWPVDSYPVSAASRSSG
jgi:hypothetical protein